jgi:pilus assembly protein Flp/PilA
MGTYSKARAIIDRRASMAHFSGLSRREGQGLAEYALILSLIAIVVIAVLLFMGGNIKTILSTIGKAL